MTSPRNGRSAAWMFALLLAAVPAAAQPALTLDEALALARTQSAVVQAAQNEAEIAANDVSWGNAGWLPRLVVTAGYNGALANTQQTFFGDRGTIDRTGALTTRRSAAALLDWTVFDGLGRSATYARLGAQREQAALTAAQIEEAVRADVVIAYYDVVRQQQQVEVQRGAVALSRERVRIAEARLDLGSASELEVRQARLDLNADRAAALREQAALAEAKVRFNALLQRDPTADFEAVTPMVVDSALVLAPLLDRVAEQNPGVQAAEQAQDVAALTVREVRAERLPRLDASVGYAYSTLDSEAGQLVESQSADFTYGLALTYDLFDGFDRRRRAQNAVVRLQNARLQAGDVRLQAEAAAAQFYAVYRTALQRIALEEENLGYARQNVDVALERFRLGTITSVELREVQEALTQAQSRLVTARFDAKRTETELRRLAGEL